MGGRLYSKKFAPRRRWLAPIGQARGQKTIFGRGAWSTDETSLRVRILGLKLRFGQKTQKLTTT